MIRVMQVSFVAVIILILAFGLFQLATSAAGFNVAGPEPNVGWNTKPTSFFPGGDEPNVGWNSKLVASVPPLACVSCPLVKPSVGWNA